jgi:hypothetical protein
MNILKETDDEIVVEFLSVEQDTDIDNWFGLSSIEWKLTKNHHPAAREDTPRTLAKIVETGDCFICVTEFTTDRLISCSGCALFICRPCYKKLVRRSEYDHDNCTHCNSPYHYNSLRRNRAFLRREEDKNPKPAANDPPKAKKPKYATTHVICCGRDLGTDMVCAQCSRTYCDRCLCEKTGPVSASTSSAATIEEDTHVCDAQNLETARTIRGTTKACPKCRVLIEKSYGCNHMFCTRCCTSYDWATGAILRNSSNPLFHNFNDQAGLNDLAVLPHLEYAEWDQLVMVIREAEAFIFREDYGTAGPQHSVYRRFVDTKLSAIFAELCFTLLMRPFHELLRQYDAICGKIAREPIQCP